MVAVRGADIYDVNVRVVEQFRRVGRQLRDAVARAPLLQRVSNDIAAGHNLRLL